MTAAEFVLRLDALGYEYPAAAARALGLNRSTLTRIYDGGEVSPHAERLLQLLEAGQPARMTPAMQKALLASSGNAGEPVAGPIEVLVELKDGGIVTRWSSHYVLTKLGARCVTWLRQTQVATQEVR